MGLTRSEIFSEDQNKLAALFKVLAHPARIAILQYTIDNKTSTCNDLITALGLAQATISQHLKELKDSEILNGKIEGKSVIYTINPEQWVYIRGSFAVFFAQDISNSE